VALAVWVPRGNNNNNNQNPHGTTAKGPDRRGSPPRHRWEEMVEANGALEKNW
jgi:hypothetical protein